VPTSTPASPASGPAPVQPDPDLVAGATARLAVATRDGIVVPGLDHRVLAGRSIDALASDGSSTWALVDGREVHRIDAVGSEVVGRLAGGGAHVLHLHAGTAWLGGGEACVWRLGADGEVAPVTTFDEAPTHDRWSTPWGGPPSIFTMASHGPDLYVSVHVGGILRSDDTGRSWTATIDLATDVHQVATAPDGTVWAATGAAGLAESRDRGATWRTHTDGLHATYALAVAVTDDGPIVSVSSGHASTDGALYRFDGERFERLAQGLPHDLGGAVGPRQLSAQGGDVAVALPGGVLCTSVDSGRTWTISPDLLPGAREVLVR
jgi:hypothetical protein